MKNILIAILVLLSFAAFSQDILLQQNVKSDTVRPAYGPNLKNFFHGYVGLGFPIYTNEEVNETKTVPDININDKEKIQVNLVESSAWLRINMGRRGNFIGNYLDLGGFGGWNFQKKHKTINTNAEDEKVKVSTSKLKYVENFSYGFIARVGASRYALSAQYRLSDLFKSSYAMPELPRLIIGFELGLFRK